MSKERGMYNMDFMPILIGIAAAVTAPAATNAESATNEHR